MRKVILAKLAQEEADRIFECERHYNTMLTLLQNQFIDVNEKKNIRESLPDFKQRVNQEYKNIISKYNLPYISNSRYRVNSETYELYVDVY